MAAARSGMRIAFDRQAMPKALPLDFPWHCHWSQIDGPSRAGRARKTTVWVCEHPYRTLRPSGPGPECEGCPNRVRAADGPPRDPAPDPFARLASKLVH
jgi:hypothetical protein